MMKRIVALPILLVLIVLILSSSVIAQENSVIELDKDIYAPGEIVTIYLNKESFEGTRLIIQVGEKEFTYQGGLQQQINFLPEELGNHKIIFRDIIRNIIFEKEFSVWISSPNEEFPTEINEIDNSRIIEYEGTILEKSVFSLGEIVVLNLEGIHYSKLRITFEDQVYMFMGQKEFAEFKPQIAGIYLVQISTPEGEIIKEFEVIDNSDEPIEEPVDEDDLFDFDYETKIIEIRKADNTRTNHVAEVIEKTPDNKTTLLVEFASSKINKIKIKDIEPDSVLNIGIEEELPQIKIGDKKTISLFSIDPEQMNFSEAEVSVTAQGDELWKCADWNFTTQICQGNWVKIKDITRGQTYTINLTALDPGYAETGVSSINTRKPIYHPNEIAELVVVVLDTNGRLVQNASVSLQVINPNNVSEYFYTGSTITETERGIYETSYNSTSIEGNYTLIVSAIGPNVNSTMISYFTVQSFYEFDILRDTPVTTDPWIGPFSSTITIISLNGETNFNFTEVLPIQFNVTNAGEAIVTTQGNSTLLTWTGLTNNSQVFYSAHPPTKVPNLYALGQSIVSYGSQTFIEARPWYLAIDPWVNNTIVDESYESTDPYYYDAAGNWTRSGPGSTAWDRSTGDSQCGAAGAHVDGAWGTDPGATTYITLDSNLANLSGASNAYISFYWRCDAQFDGGEDFSYDEYYSGGWNNDVYSYNLGGCTGNDWSLYQRTLPVAALQEDFTVRFAVEASSSNEDFYLDCFTITMEYFQNVPPNVTLEYPPIVYNTETYSTYKDIDFNCSVIDDLNATNISLYITNNQNASFAFNNSCTISSTSTSCNWTETLMYGNYTWNCLAYDSNDAFDWGDTNYSIEIINTSLIPKISNTLCDIQGTGWADCTTVGFGDTLQSVRTNCDSNIGGTISNVSFFMQNVEDSRLYFNNTITTNASGYWEYDFSDFTIYDSGSFNLHMTCKENPENSTDVNWTIPWGTLTTQLFSPTGHSSVSQNQFFNYSTRITCNVGECGNVSATLDPPFSWWNTNWPNRISLFLNESVSNARTDEPITITLFGLTLSNNCTSDIRVISNESGSNVEIPSQILDGDDSTWCQLVFLANISASAVNENNYFVYYGYDSGVPTYIDTMTSSYAVNDYYIFNTSSIYVRYELADVWGGRGGGPTVEQFSTPAGTLFSPITTYAMDDLQDAETNGVIVTEVDGPLYKRVRLTTNLRNETISFYAKQNWYEVNYSVLTIGGNDFHVIGINGATTMWYDGTSTAGTGEYTASTYFWVESPADANKGVGIAVSGVQDEPFDSATANDLDYNAATDGWYVNNDPFTTGYPYWVFTNDDGPSGANTTATSIKNPVIIGLGAEEDVSKGIIPMNSGVPFYTTYYNPVYPGNNSCLFNMSAGDSCDISWMVNATGEINSSWEFYAYYIALNYSSYISNGETTHYNITIMNNIAPFVDSISISPSQPGVGTDLNCTFNVSDINSFDPLTANVSWYYDGTLGYSEIINVTNGVYTIRSLGSGNTSAGQSWHCGVTPSDEYLTGNQLNSSTTLVLASLPPTVNQIQCREGVAWTACSNLLFGDDLTAVRASCSDPDGYIENATFTFENVGKSITYFSNTTFDNSTGYWVFDNNDLVINGSGTYNLTVGCVDNTSSPGYDSSSWIVPWGTLTAYLYNPDSDSNVTQNKFFNFTSYVTCTGGECGDVNATLDPIPGWWDAGWEYRKKIVISENSGFNLTDYQVNISLDTQTLISQGKLQSGCQDLRFVDNDSTALYHHLIQGCNTTDTHAWVKASVLANSNETIYVYYGNSIVASVSDPDNTYFIYEDMDSAPSATIIGDAAYMNDAIGVRITTASNNLLGFMYWVANPGPGFYGYYKTWAGGGNGADSTWFGIHSDSVSSTREDITDGGYHFTVDEYQDRIAFTKSTTDNGASIAQWGSATLDDAAWHTFEVEFFNDGSTANAEIYYDGVLRVNGTDTTTIRETDGQYFLIGGRTGGQTNEHRINNVTVRKLVRPEPTFLMEGEVPNNKGLIPMNSGSPFYTITANPMLPANNSCLTNMIGGDTCYTTWEVNATGPTGIPFEFFVIYDALNYSPSVLADISSHINITIVQNQLPYASSVDIYPGFAFPDENLTCIFTIDDTNFFDILSANVSWYNNGTLGYSEIVNGVPNGVETNTTLYWGNTTLSEEWWCGVTPSDEDISGTQVNSTSAFITAVKPPSINEIQCYRNNAVWASCTNLVFGDIFSGVRVNCTSQVNTVVNATFNLTNIPDLQTYFTGTSYSGSGDWWEFYYNETINNSGRFETHALCYDNESASDNGYVNWTVPWGTLVGTLITPDSDAFVEKNEFFTFLSQVSCVGGECGSVVSLLDPEQPESPKQSEGVSHYSPVRAYTGVNTKRGGNEMHPEGVVAINSLRSSYLPNQEAKLLAVLLDEYGEFMTTGDFLLSLISPDGSKQIFSTNDFKKEKDGVYSLDYELDEQLGVYELLLESINNNFIKKINNSFEVKASLEFELVRDTPAAINPWEGLFKSKIRVESVHEEPFVLIETIPNSFEVLEAVNASVWTSGDKINILWSGLTNGSEVEYMVSPPKVSPEIFEFQATISYDGQLFEEERPWLIASDPQSYYSAVSDAVAGYSDGGYTIEDAGSYANTVSQDCAGGTCTNSNSWIVGMENFADGEPYDCEFNATMEFNISDISPDYLQNVSIGWSGCWHGDETQTNNNCDDDFNPEWDDGTGGGTFRMKIFDGTSYQNMDCINTAGSECGAGIEINLGTDAVGPSWGEADAYNSFTFRKDIDSNYVNNDMISIIWNFFGTNVCADSNGDDDIIMVIDYANLSVGWEYLIKSGAVSTIIGDDPFYTTDANPQNYTHQSCLQSMIAGDACNVSWQVNATGGINTVHEFYVIYNSTNHHSYVSNDETPHIDITIRDTSEVPPIVTLEYPPPNFFTNQAAVNFNCSATDNVGLYNMTLYADFNGTFLPNGTNSVGGTSNSTIFPRTLNDGIYLWNCLAFDDDGNPDWATSNYTLTIDTLEPTIILIDPSEGQPFYTGNIAFNFTVLDNVDLDLTCNITVDSSVRNDDFSALNGSITTSIVNGLPQATHYWNVTCWDDAGNYNTSETWSFNITEIPPNVTLVTGNDSYFNSPNVFLEYYPTDNNDVTDAWLYLNGSFNQNNTNVTIGTTNNFTIVGLGEGIYNWTVEVYDVSNLSAIAPERWFTVDLTPPAIELFDPIDNYNTTNGTIQFNFTATDNFDLILVCNISVEGTIFDENFDADNGSFTIRPVTIPDGFLDWNITCVDEAGNLNTSETRTMNISSPPVIQLDDPQDNYSQSSGDIVLFYIPTDNSDIDVCTLLLDGAINDSSSADNGLQNNFTVTSLSEGNYNWTVNCTDDFGLQGIAPQTWSFIIDSTEPSIVLNYPLPNETFYASSIEFNYTASDTVSATLTCNITVDGSEPAFDIISNSGDAVNITVPIVGDGIHWWNVTCLDEAGNLNTSETRNFTTFAPPDITLFTPADNAIYNYATEVNFTYLPIDSDGIQNASLVLNGVKVLHNYSVANNAQNNFTYNFPSDGIYIWTINATDNISLEGMGTPLRTLTIDTTPPVITYVSPNESEVMIWNNISFEFIVTDNVDTDDIVCNISIADNPEWTNITLTNGSTYTNFKGLYDGDYNWSVTCIDDANNTNTYTQINFSVLAPPNVTLNYPIDNLRTKDRNITFNYTPEDFYSFENCSFYFNSVFNDTSSSIAGNDFNYFNLTNLPDGTYNWTVECVDELPDGNVFTPTPENFTIDNLGPTIVLNYPGEGQPINENNVTFNWTATDIIGINLTCNLTLDGVLNLTNITNASGTDFLGQVNGLLDGDHNWSITCIDDLGNVNTSALGNFTINQADLYINSTRIYFSNTNPDLGENITIFANVTNIGGNPANNVLVEFWDGPIGSGTLIENDTRNVAVNSTIIFNTTWIIGAGYHNVWVAVDPNNLIEELVETNNNATINISVLSANITFPLNNSWTNIADVEINFTLHDYTSGAINYTIIVDTVPNGQNGTVNDNASNLLNVTLAGEAIHSILVRATDDLGRIKDSNIIFVTFDQAPPVPSFNTLNGTFFNDTTPEINFTITDNLANTINYTVYVNGVPDNSSSMAEGSDALLNLSVLAEGEYNITLEGIDEAGNRQNESIFIFIDQTEPTITLEYPPNGANLTNVIVDLNFSVTDNLDQLLTCNLTLDGNVISEAINISNGTTSNTTTVPLNEGDHYWNVTCWDGRDMQNIVNTNTSETRLFSVFIPPNITLISPQDSYWTNNATESFYFNATDDSGLENCSILIDGNVNNTKLGINLNNGGISNIFASGLNGTHDWAIECYDNSSQYAYTITSSRTIYVDLDAPYPYIETANGTWFNTPNPLIDFNITDNMDVALNYTFYVNGTANVQGTASNGTSLSDNLQNLNNGTYWIVLEAYDNATNRRNSTNITIHIDTVEPSIQLHYPEADNITSNSSVYFNWTGTDNMAGLLECNLTVDGTVQITVNVTNGIAWNETLALLAGDHDWSVTCIDYADNVNTSEMRNFTIPSPDLYIESSNIQFNNSNPQENETVTINATISNIGNTDAGIFIVQFYNGDPLFGGIQINGNITVPLLVAGTNITVNISYNTIIGNNYIFVLVDVPLATNGQVFEDNETNNEANKTFIVEQFHIVAGTTNDELRITDVDYIDLFEWGGINLTDSNVYVTDTDSVISWTTLQAISRNISNASTTNDFEEMDIAFGSTAYPDSMNTTYTLGGNPITTQIFTVFSSDVLNVPIVNSTNTSDFTTGILWDYNDGNTEYNGTQDLVFITEINIGKVGLYGTYDYEIKIPAPLRSYIGATDTVTFYTEIK